MDVLYGWSLRSLLWEAEGAEDVVPEALLAVDDLVDEARLTVGSVVGGLVGAVGGLVGVVGWFVGVVRWPRRERWRLVRWWPVRRLVPVVRWNERWSEKG